MLFCRQWQANSKTYMENQSQRGNKILKNKRTRGTYTKRK